MLCLGDVTSVRTCGDDVTGPVGDSSWFVGDITDMAKLTGELASLSSVSPLPLPLPLLLIIIFLQKERMKESKWNPGGIHSSSFLFRIT